MSLCTVCGRAMCDHEPDERGQTYEEMMRPLSPEEEGMWEKTWNPDDLIEFAQKHAHDPVLPPEDAKRNNTKAIAP